MGDIQRLRGGNVYQTRGECYAQRVGFSVVELLVVIATIGLLTAVLMPAVQSAREAARGVKCRNNLKQIGVGLYNCHLSHGAFPFGNQGRKYPGGKWLGWGCWPMGPTPYLLPFIEQESIYDQINFAIDPCDDGYHGTTDHYFSTNGPAFRSQISILLCRSDGASFHPQERGNWTDGFGLTNYLANFGTKWNYEYLSDGPFFILRATRIADIVDGASHTAAFSEHAQGSNGVSRINSQFHLRDFFRRPTDVSTDQADLERWCQSQGGQNSLT